MRPRDRRNPHRLIVEGPDDLHTVVHLTTAHGVDWESDGSSAPFIRDAGGLEGALRELPTSVTLGVIGLISRICVMAADGETGSCGQTNLSCRPARAMRSASMRALNDWGDERNPCR